MTPEEVAVHVVARYLPSEADRNRREQLRHWTAEALAIVSDSCHWQIIEHTRRQGFRTNSRVISKEIGVSVDRVHVALARLLRLRLLKLGSGNRWKDLLGAGRHTESAFRKLALVRIREMASRDGVNLCRLRTEVNT